MGSLNFEKDDHAEYEIARIFKMAGFQYELIKGHDPGKDIIITLPRCCKDPWTGQLIENIWVEVKNDQIGGSNRNFGIEWWSRDKPSGIQATDSMYWVNIFAPAFFDINEDIVTIWLFKVGRLRDAILELTDEMTDEPREFRDIDNRYGSKAWLKYDCGDDGSRTHLWICRQHHIGRYAEFIGNPSELLLFLRGKIKGRVSEYYDEDPI